MRAPCDDQSGEVETQCGLESAGLASNWRRAAGGKLACGPLAGLVRLIGSLAGGQRVALTVFGFICVLMGAWEIRAANIEAPEYRIKAAYVLNFGLYGVWPTNTFASLNEPFVIGVIGNDDVAQELQGIALKQKINNRKIQIRRIGPGDNFSGSHILFVGKGQNVEAILRRIGSASVLTVGEEPGFNEKGGMFSFVLVGENLLFDSNPSAIAKAGLEVSSKVLRLSRRIVETAPKGSGGKR